MVFVSRISKNLSASGVAVPGPLDVVTAFLVDRRRGREEPCRQYQTYSDRPFLPPAHTTAASLITGSALARRRA